MTSDPHNSIVDSLLDEILGEQQPPDLTDRILDRYRDQDQAESTVSVSPPRRRRSSRWSVRNAAAIAASLLVSGMLLGLVVNRLNRPIPGGNDEIAGQGEAAQPSRSVDGKDRPSEPSRPVDKTPSQDDVLPGTLAEGDFPREDLSPPGSAEMAATIGPRDTIPALAYEVMVSSINQEMASTWEERELVPSSQATDAEWCRRVFLRLIGRIPTADELQQFLSEPGGGNRHQLVEMLLEGENYIEEYARHWTNIWTNTLIGRRGGMANNDLANREGLQHFLRQSFQRNKPYDQLVFELLSATGSSTPGSEQYNGAVNFLLACMGKDTSLATAKTTSIFLGQKLQCVQCHNHPFNEIAQKQFWEMDAFFSQMAAIKDPGTEGVVLVDRDYSSGQQDQSGSETFYQQPDGQVKAAYPSFLGQGASSRSGRLEQFDRRNELAQQVRYSEHLSRALVNRIWGHFFGYGFTTSVDEMGAHSPVSHPELLENLASQFEAHGYDMKSLFRWVCLSDAFSLSSRYSENNLADTPGNGEIPAFSRYYTRSMQPEEVYQSLLLLAGVRRDEQPFAEQQLAQRAWLGQFTRRMENDEAEESSSFAGDVHQSLVMMNGPLMQQATSPVEAEGVLGTVIDSRMSFQDKVQHMFMAAISRPPTAEESKVVGMMLSSADNPAAMLQDIWWALLNSNEFILDH